MTPSRIALAAGALAVVALTACASQANPPQMSRPLPPEVMSCNADAAKAAAVGKTASADVVERARTDAGAQAARVLKPGQMVTMEYQEGRLNIDVDENNVIVAVRCG
ncbi:Elastase inhibitor AFLEI Flags: Precursor [Lysobacter sp. 5GHs7-4]|uniref:I78 family peptidase inhibitor n=1 Tax=Lysobacter sp. 5GHs7-4 TaxID=2904253 RepID=UPI001E442A16|nr:I78 family peptidase inhibitor [Lysobacter sp. 5GHs7-4]UHQ23497.1 Elastase inhibitor AFLEI Flags: Precursor [Lysobacter sp. 5GHs7-4]